MKKQYRLKRNEDFQKVISKKRNLANASFAAYFYPNNLGHARIGISVSVKLGKAVVRNKIKRQVRMMVLQSVDLSKSADFIFIVRKRYLNKTFEENLKALQELSAKIMFKLDKEV